MYALWWCLFVVVECVYELWYRLFLSCEDLYFLGGCLFVVGRGVQILEGRWVSARDLASVWPDGDLLCEFEERLMRCGEGNFVGDLSFRV